MSTPTFQLDDLDWSAVCVAATRSFDPSEHIRADALSLAALYSNDFHHGLACVARAREAEPLNPVHAVRHVLQLLRFGQTSGALELAQSLQDQLPGVALPAFLRALATHRDGEYKRAVNAAADVVAAHPTFAPARFLQAESQLRFQFKGLRKLLTGLPPGEAYAASWLDLAAKLVLSGGDEGRELASELAKNTAVFPPASREKALIDDLLQIRDAGFEALEKRLATTVIGSRTEELILLFHGDRLDERSSPAAAVEALRRLWARYPEREAVRRLYVARLTRVAVDLSVQEKYAEALRVVEHCMQLEPHETTHFQNQAALFTLLRETEPYHDAWFAVDRHQYRLAALGRVSAADALELARPHRLFAQQARLPAEGPIAAGSRRNLGILIETTRAKDGAPTETILAVNNERISHDPDLLRQWIHHRRAELTFLHWALGQAPRRFLLDPENGPSGRKRLSALASCARSLEILVPEEGPLLAARIVSAWSGYSSRLDPSYTAPPEDSDVYALKLLHLETFGDLALLCLTWKPDGGRAGLVEDVLGLLQEEGPFFEDALLLSVLQLRQSEASYALKFLAGFINDSLGLDPTRSTSLTDTQRDVVVGRFAGELLTRLAYRVYEEHRNTELGAHRALSYVERARSHDKDNVRTELTAARFLLLAGHDDESRATLAKLQRSARAREPEIHSEIEELRQILEERAKSGAAGRPRAGGSAAAPIDVAVDTGLVELEAEIERYPGAIQAYEELSRMLVADGLLHQAVDWSERAITQCLGRDGQVRARSLNIEMLGLRTLGERNSGVARLYVTGAHRPALELLEALPETIVHDYTLDFLLGQCRLALGRPEDARQAFERALEHCGRQLHRTVLRRLAMDVDQPYLETARRPIADKIAAGAFEDALHEVWSMMARLQRPDAAFLDLAQIHLEAAVARVGSAHPPLPVPAASELQLRSGALAEAYSADSDLERARRLARLSLSIHEPSRRKAELILRKAAALEEQTALAEILARSGALLRQGNIAEALAALDAAGAAGSAEPRVVRQRALLLLNLDRFAEADAAARSLEGSTAPLAIEFLRSFPSLACRQRIAAASKRLRDGDSAAANAILEGASAVDRDQTLELAYCRSFARTMDAYRLRRASDEPGARVAFSSAMDQVEPHVATARASGHGRLIDLYETLDKELDHER
jgi:tetratricopeptide (TPR) repeat protein